MKKQATALVSFIFLIASATALTASIDQNSPDDIVLKSSNSFSVTKTFSSSSSSGDIKSREWNLLDSSQTDSGVNGEFTFARDNGVSGSNTLRLTVSDGGSSKVDEVTQVVHDVPTVSISSGSTSEGETKSVDKEDSVSFSSSVTDVFDNSLTYTWKVDGTDEGSGNSFSKTFSNSGTYDVKLNVKDSAGYSSTSNAITVDVSGSNNNNQNQATSSTGGINTSSNQSSSGAAASYARVFSSLKPGQKEEVTPPSPKKYGVKKLEISVKSEVADVEVNMQEKTSEKPDEVGSEPEGVSNRYISIDASGLSDNQIEEASIHFSVEKDWMDSNSANKSSVRLERYHNNEWKKLETSIDGENNTHIDYTAKTPGFSYFAVTAEETQQDDTQDQAESDSDSRQQTQEDQTTAETQSDQIEDQDSSNKTADSTDEGQSQVPWMPLATAALLLVGILVAYFKREDIRAI